MEKGEKMNQKKQTIWSRDFILVCLVALAVNICMRMLDSNLASYANETWNSKSLGGQLTSFLNIGSILMAFFAGKIVEVRGRKNSLIVFCLLFAIPTVLFVLIPIPGVALGVRLIQGIAKGVVTVAMASVVSDVIPREKMNEGMGMYNLGSTISMAIGPMIGLMLVEKGGYAMMFIACAVTYGSGAFFSAFMKYEKKNISEKKTTEESMKKEAAISEKKYRGVWALIEKKAILSSLINTIFFGGYACILVYVTIYAQEVLKLSAGQISLFYTVAAVAMLIIRFTTAKVADKYGAMWMIAPGHIIMIGALLLLAFPAKSSYLAFLAAGACYGIGNAAVTPALNAVAVVDSPADRGAQANACFYFLMDFGILISSSCFGKLMDAAASVEVGYQETFLISSGVLVFSLILSLLVLNEKARKRLRNA